MGSKINSDSSYSEEIKKLFEEFIPTIEHIFGRQLSKEQRKEIEEKLGNLKQPIIEYAHRVEGIKNGDMVQLATLSNELMKELVPDIPEGTSGLEYIHESLFKQGEIKIGYIRNSNYVEYLNCMNDIVRLGFDQGSNKVNSYLTSVDNAKIDHLAWAQSVAIDMGKIIKFLSLDRKRFSMQLANRCISEYGKLSGTYERLIVIVAGFVSIKSDTATDYIEFRRKGLSKCLSVISRRGWEILIEGFSILIRNSIAHKSYIFNSRTKSIDFNAPNGGLMESIPYKLFFYRTRELSCLVLALSKFRGMVSREIISNLNRNL